MKRYRNLTIMILTWLAVLSIYGGTKLIQTVPSVAVGLIVGGVVWLTVFFVSNLRG